MIGSTSETKLLDGRPERPKQDEGVTFSKDVVQPAEKLEGKGKWDFQSRGSHVMCEFADNGTDGDRLGRPRQDEGVTSSKDVSVLPQVSYASLVHVHQLRLFP